MIYSINYRKISFDSIITKKSFSEQSKTHIGHVTGHHRVTSHPTRCLPRSTTAVGLQFILILLYNTLSNPLHFIHLTLYVYYYAV